MNEPDIVLTRVDNRLVHGQVGVVWTSSVGANLLLVANDDTAEDELQQQLMAATADSSGVGIRFWSVDKTISTIHKASTRQHIFLVVRTPQDARRLVEGGVPIHELNIGNMHFSDGKEQVTKYTYMNQQDKDDLRAVANAGVNVFIQETPDDKKIKIQEVI